MLFEAQLIQELLIFELKVYKMILMHRIFSIGHKSFSDDPTSADEFHQEFHPPPEGSYTGTMTQPKVQPVMDPSNDREQVQTRSVSHAIHCFKLQTRMKVFIYLNLTWNLICLSLNFRLSTFQDTLPKLEKWYGKFGVLHKINADKPRGETCK